MSGGFLLDTMVPSELSRPRPDSNVHRWLTDTDDALMFISAIVSFGYDGTNRINAVSGRLETQVTSYASNFAYAAFGQPTNYQYGNGLGRVTAYNARLQVQSYTDQSNNNASSPLLSAALSWGTTNNNGNLLGVTYTHSGSGYATPLVFADTFSYDNVNRLSAAKDALNSATGTTEWSQGFGYDAYGNMWVSSFSGITPPGNTPQSNVYNSANNRMAGGAYDAAGDQTVVNGNTLACDAEGREVTNTSSGTETYVYDGNGKRVQKFNSSSATTFVYDALGQLGMEVSSLATVPSCWTCYLSADHLGTTRLVTDGSGNVIARHDYLPFGQETGSSAGRGVQFGASDNVNQKFTPKERDSESGLDYFGARYYGLALGRFTSPDWSAVPTPVPYAKLADPQTLNLYGYMTNNPLSGVDKDGHCGPKDHDDAACDSMDGTIFEGHGGQMLVGATIAGAAAFGGEIAAAARVGWTALAGFFLSQQGQQMADQAVEALAPPGANIGLGQSFGFTTVEGTIEGFTHGRFANGAEVAAKVTQTGENVTASILGAFNPDGAKAAGTIKSIMQGAEAVAKEQGATSLTIQAVAVTNPKLAKLLTSQGFAQTTIKVGDQTVKAYEKKIQLQ